MALTIKARIPEDNGKTLQFGSGPGGELVVASELCEGYNCACSNTAIVITRGETDSFGWEPVYYCADCLAKCEASCNEYSDATDVEDRAGFFYVSEGTNIDGHGDWDNTFTSYRAAMVYLRNISDRADRYGGLYPNKGVRECNTAEELEVVKARFARARKELEDELYGCQDEEEDEDDWEDDGWASEPGDAEDWDDEDEEEV